jgi:hypothetical protein
MVKLHFWQLASQDLKGSSIRERARQLGRRELWFLYLELLYNLHINGGSMAADPETLSEEIGFFTPKEVAEMLPLLAPRPGKQGGIVVEDGRISNPRLSREISVITAIRSKAGKASAASRLSNTSQHLSTGVVTLNRNLNRNPITDEASLALRFYNTVLKRSLGPTAGNLRVIRETLKAGYSVAHLATAFVVARWGPDRWYMEEKYRTDLSLLLRFKGGTNTRTGREAKRHLDSLVEMASRTTVELFGDEDEAVAMAVRLAEEYGGVKVVRGEAVAAPMEWPEPTAEAMKAWQRIAAVLKERINPHSFAQWFRPLVGQAITEDTLVVRVPSKEFRERLEAGFRPMVDDAALASGGPKHVVLRVDPC